MRKGIFVFLCGAGLAALLFLHHLIPTTRGLALMVESILPWTWILIVLLVIAALIRFSVWSVIGVLIPGVIWAQMFGAYFKPTQEPDRTDIVVATQNVGARLPEPSATALNIVEQKPDIVTLQEIESLSGKIIQEQMNKSFKHHKVVDTVGMWSRWPIRDVEEVDLGLSWPRAFAATVKTDHGSIRVYSVHMPSVRPGRESLRNAALKTIAQKVSEDPAKRVIVAGDFNSTTTDRYFSDLNETLTDSRRAVGGGFGFTWPSQFPMARLDHVLVRGMQPVSDTVLPPGTSDHRAVVAGLNVK